MNRWNHTLVVGLPDERWGNRVAAVVALRAGSGATDGIQEVPDPMRSIEPPSGSGAIDIAMAGMGKVSPRTAV